MFIEFGSVIASANVYNNYRNFISGAERYAGVILFSDLVANAAVFRPYPVAVLKRRMNVLEKQLIASHKFRDQMFLSIPHKLLLFP